MTTKPCESCGNQFVVNKTRNAHNYCSRLCLQKHRSEKVKSRRKITVQCLNCQKLISCWDSNPRKYCSNKCNYAHRTIMGIPAKRSLRRALIKYKITQDDWDKLLKIQDERCAICRQPSTTVINGRIKRLAIDHCHETNQVRGLLCSCCNAGLGMFNDDWLLLENAIEYLGHWHNKHGSSKVQSVQESPALN